VRVLQVAPSFPRIGCGIGDHIARLAAELAGRGVEVHIATDRPGAAPPRAAGGATVHEVFHTHTLREMQLAARLARDLRPDVVHIQHQIITYSGRAAILSLPRLLQSGGAGTAGTPVIVTLHDLQLPRIFRGAGPLRRILLRGYLRRADTVVVNSAAQRGQALAAGAREPAVRILRIPSNIDLQAPAAAELQELQTRFGLGDRRLVVSFGTVAPSTGIELLLRAVAEIPAAARQRLRCLIVGQAAAYAKDPAGDLQAVRDRAAALGLQSTVTVTGFLPPSEVSALLQLSDAVVLPRHQAIAASTAAAAAFLHARPLLAIGAGAAIEDAAIPASAIHWSPPEPAALAGALGRLAQGEPLWAETARRDLAANAESFSWAHVAGKYHDLYREIAR
jgi:glycosyltransferase involved in cell wall biosynthesis